jgi:hypothetical protein
VSDQIIVPDVLLKRRQGTARKLELLALQFEIFGLCEGRDPHVVLLATGSLGRHEAGSRSDLDVFLVDTAREQEHELRNLDSILLRADLIKAARQAEFDDFSRDGEYLIVHRIREVLSFLGTREDDSSNAFTARLLLLLESHLLLGADAYERCVSDVIGMYSRDAKSDTNFAPHFLINDIVRYWKTLCLNYEGKRHAYHVARQQPIPSARADAAAHREAIETMHVDLRVDLLKLRFNRLWTCFNGLAFLLAGVEDRWVSREHVRELVALTPVERAVALASRLPATAEFLQTALALYGEFLTQTDGEKGVVRMRFSSDETYHTARASGSDFGDQMDEVIRIAADHAGLQRFLLL